MPSVRNPERRRAQRRTQRENARPVISERECHQDMIIDDDTPLANKQASQSKQGEISQSCAEPSLEPNAEISLHDLPDLSLSLRPQSMTTAPTMTSGEGYQSIICPATASALLSDGSEFDYIGDYMSYEFADPNTYMNRVNREKESSTWPDMIPNIRDQGRS